MDLLNANQEAALVGRSKSRVSRARQDPDHPANGPHARLDGRSVLAPADAITRYWAAQDATPGPAPTAPYRLTNLTRTQWAGLEAIGAGRGSSVSGITRGRLHALGLTSSPDTTAQPTQAGRALLDQHATDGAPTTET